MVGCAEHDDVGQSSVQQQEKICLGAEIQQIYATRASATGFADGDQMGVYIVDYDGDNPSVLLLPYRMYKKTLSVYNKNEPHTPLDR